MKTTAQMSIYIIEDDAHFRETFIDVMSLKGVEVQGAGTGEEGLKALKGLKPDVILLDVQLPGIDGFEICRRIKRQEAFKKTPVIFISASTKYSDPRDRVEGLMVGASLFVPKPITMERLWGEIEYLLQKRR